MQQKVITNVVDWKPHVTNENSETKAPRFFLVLWVIRLTVIQRRAANSEEERAEKKRPIRKAQEERAIIEEMTPDVGKLGSQENTWSGRATDREFRCELRPRTVLEHYTRGNMSTWKQTVGTNRNPRSTNVNRLISMKRYLVRFDGFSTTFWSRDPVNIIAYYCPTTLWPIRKLGFGGDLTKLRSFWEEQESSERTHKVQPRLCFVERVQARKNRTRSYS